MADHMPAELLTAMADQLGRAVEQVWHECECDICGQCGKMPRECSGTRCAETCQCSVCDHCIASSLIAEHKATVARPVTYGTAERLRAEVRNVALYARQKCADAVDIDALHFALIAIANSLDQAAARLSGMAAVPNFRELITGMSVSVDVSTCEDDAGHRYFGTVTEVMDDPDDKHGVTLLVQDAEPNFTPAAPEPPHV